MRYLCFWAALTTAVLSQGCISLPDIEPPSETPGSGVPDAGTPDAGAPDAGGPRDLVLQFLSPESTVHTNGQVVVRLRVPGGTAETVELLVDDRLLTILPSTFAYTWDTTSIEEGAHVLKARVTRAGQTFFSPERVVVVDRTSPRLVSRLPLPGDEEVSVRQPIQATFDEVLDTTTVTNTSFQLLSGASPIPGTLSLSGDGMTLTVVPAMTLAVPAAITLQLENSIKDLAGNPIDVTTVTGWQWSLPTAFPLGGLSANPGATHASGEVVKQAPDGSVVVAWSEEDGTNRNVHVSRWKDGVWESLGGPLSGYPGKTWTSSQVSLELDALGNPVVAWAEGKVNQGEPVILVWKWDGTAWKPLGGPLDGDTLALMWSQPPYLRLDATGAPLIVWSEWGNQQNVELMFAARWNGTGWSMLGNPRPLADANHYRAGIAAMDLDSNGNPVVALVARRNSDDVVYDILVLRWDFGEWMQVGPTIAGTYDAANISSARIQVASDGTPWVAWVEGGLDWDKPGIIVVKKLDGSAWVRMGSEVRGLPGSTPIRSVQLELAKNGRHLLAWTEHRASGGDAQVCLSEWVGLDWRLLSDSLGVISDATPGYFTVHLSSEPTGMPTLSWVAFDGTANSIVVTRYNR